MIITYIQEWLANRARKRDRSAIRHARHRCRRRRRMRMMYQGRNFDHISRLLIGDGGADDRAGSEGLLFLGRCAPLRQTLEALESVIDEHPVLVYYLAVLWHWRGRYNEIKLKDVIKGVSFSTSIECNNVTLRAKMHIRISSFTSGNSSKLDVSSMDRTSTGMAAGLSLMCSQSTPRKKGANLSSSMPRCAPKE